jgi:predicted MFS family arabinose efflux permease
LLATAAGWHVVFYIAAALNLTTALLAVLVLRPLRARRVAEAAKPA